MKAHVGNSSGVRPKKRLGQHFLTDKNLARKIAESLDNRGDILLEIGPGTGSLTQYLIESWGEKLWLVEIDNESVEFLKRTHPALVDRIIEGDFLSLDLQQLFNGRSLSIIGNFPYYISSQILFKAIEGRKNIVQLVGMFQEEVARRICSPPGSKEYGILSVLVQAYFDASFLFSVPPTVFVPQPAVNSAVIKLVAKKGFELKCDEGFFKKVVKAAFNQRRKKLSNALAGLAGNGKVSAKFAGLRAEQLSWKDFEELTIQLGEVNQ